jgi:hypothetical protein
VSTVLAADSFAGISAGDWTAIGTITLAVVAAFALGANVASARITSQASQATRRAAEATERAAQATRDDADASRATVDEMRRDRELAYRPHLSWVVSGTLSRGETIEDPGSVNVVNFGRGPAIYCLCFATWKTQGFAATTDLFDVSPNGDGTVPLLPVVDSVPDDTMAGAPVPAGQPNRLAFCKDQLGNYYRFVPYQDTEVWREGDAERPRWVDFYLHHYDRLKK